MNFVPNRTLSTAWFLPLALFVWLMSGSLGCGRRGKAPGSTAAASASASSARPSASALAASLGKDACAGAADRCACAAEHGAQLLGACFPDRALQLVSRAPASCATAAFLGVQAEALAALERGAEASSAAKKALQSEPNNRFARRALAISALQSKDFDAADAALQKLTAEDAKDVDSLYYLALSQRRRGKYNAARERFLAVLRLDAEHIDARFNLVTLTAAAGAEQEAEHDYQELLQIAPVGDPRLDLARAVLRDASKQGAKALPVIQQTSPTPSIAPSR